VILPALVPFSKLPDLSVPVRFPLPQLITLADLVSLIHALTSPNVTVPPGLMVQVAAARAGPALRPMTTQTVMPVSRVRAGRENVIDRIRRAYGGRPDPSRSRLALAAALVQAALSPVLPRGTGPGTDLGGFGPGGKH